MNPRIAVLREVYPDRPAEDRAAATYATFDSEGVYRLYVLTIQRLDEWLLAEWERRLRDGGTLQGWFFDDGWNRVAA